jgi:acyl-CoA reductase-like NAD-dependent aldehyde dehydrogenase
MGVAEAKKAAEAAAAAFPAWSALGPNARRAVLNKACDELAKRADAFVKPMIEELGCNEGWARFNVMFGTGLLREAAAMTTQIGGETIPSDKPGCFAMSVRQPVGVCLGIAPWNAPVILGVRAVAMPLACGNTVVLKASEMCPRTFEIIAEAFQAAGLPEGALSLVTNAPEDAADVVNALIDHPAVRRINFTGSTRVGRMIAKRAAEHLKPVLLELGGKAPLIVLEDADLDEAVKAAAFGAFMNQGQICMSTEKIIVVDSVADEFARKFAAKAKTLVAGNPKEGKTPLAAVVDKSANDRVQRLIKDAVAKGAEHLVKADASGVVMSANVVDKVTPQMGIYSEETFGPVVAMVRARNADHAVELANDTEYGLSSSVFTRDIVKGLTIAQKLQTGIAHINGPTVHDEAQMPFGGTKASGYGRFGGKAGIDQFTELRWITIETRPGHYPI